MIQSWRSKEGEIVLRGGLPKGIPADLAKAARRRLAQLDQASNLDDMRAPPGNRLHLVDGRWSISVNMQYRITFVWTDVGPEEAWFGDYH